MHYAAQHTRTRHDAVKILAKDAGIQILCHLHRAATRKGGQACLLLYPQRWCAAAGCWCALTGYT